MSKILTTLFGAGFIGSLFALRTYLGIALILSVSTCTFKNDIVDYVKESRKEAHQERLAQINFETEKMKIESLEKVKLEQEREQKAKQIVEEQIRKEKLEKEQFQARERERIRKEKENQIEMERITELRQKAHAKVCEEHYTRYRKLLICAYNPNDAVNCAQGYLSTVWANSASQVRATAVADSCNVDRPSWKN